MEHNSKPIRRRAFLAAAGFSIVNSKLVRGAQANSAVSIGLLGCGGRGTADATSMVSNAGARLVALADLFDDQLQKATAGFNTLANKLGHPAIDPSLVFRGPHAYQQIAEAKSVDAIVIATPPYFHAHHLETVVAAGKHVYCEKPVAVDVPGAHRVVEIGRKADGRLSLEVGFQIRDAPPFVELVRRIHAGDIGEIAFGEAHYFCPTLSPQHPDAPPPLARLRNWLNDRVLSGDIIVEQNIHVIDICNWVLGGIPSRPSAKAAARGVRTAVIAWPPAR